MLKLRLPHAIGSMDRWVFSLLVGGLLLRSLVAFFLYPGFDEAYYYLYSRYLDWSYFDHPLLVSLTTGLGWWLTGSISQFTIRIGALLVHSLTLVLLYLTARRLFSVQSARLTLAIATIVPLFMIGFGILTSPDNTLILFWTATCYLAACEFFPLSDVETDLPYRPSPRLALFGPLVALACLSKYHGFLLGVSLVGFCLNSHRARRALWSMWTGLALVLYGLTLFPLWFWNLNHDWLSFRFQLSMRFSGDGGTSSYSLVALLLVFLVEVVYLFPAIGFPLWWITGKSIGQQIRNQNPFPEFPLFREKQLLVLWMSLPIMLGFTLLGGKTQIFPAWPAPGFWGMTMLLGVYAERWEQQHRKGVRRWLVGSGLIVVTLALVALLHVTTGTFQKPSHYALGGGLVSPQQDPSTELLDVVQIRQRLAADPALLAELQATDFIFTNEYYLGGYVDMAVRPLTDAPVTSLTQDPRGFAIWFKPADWVGQNAIYMTLQQFAEQPEVTDRYREYFDSIEEIGTVSTERGGAVTETIHLYRAQNFKRPYIYPY